MEYSGGPHQAFAREGFLTIFRETINEIERLKGRVDSLKEKLALKNREVFGNMPSIVSDGNKQLNAVKPEGYHSELRAALSYLSGSIEELENVASATVEI